MTRLTRRGLLGGAAAGLIASAKAPDFQLVDYHAHLEGIGLDQALRLSRQRSVKFGIVAHAGKKTAAPSERLSTDAELEQFVVSLAGKPVYKGIQAEGLDWMSCFSKEAVAQLDYVLSDALTFPEKNGRLVQLWKPGATVGDKQDFMERYTAFHVEVMAREPIDILANPTFLPAEIEKEYDALWTPGRMRRIIDAALQYGVAIEINARYRVPSAAFLKAARRAGVKLSTGSNSHGEDIGKLDYCVETIQALGLTRKDMFTPAPGGHKPIETRRF